MPRHGRAALTTRLNIMAALLVIVGAVWAFQGYGELGGSFMTGRPEWLWIGLACALIGVAMLIAANLPGGRPPTR